MRRQILNNNRGQSLIEYVILVALVGVGTMGMVRLVQKSVKVNLANVISAMQGERRSYEHVNVTGEDIKKTDFSNFMKGAASDETQR